MFSDIRDNGTNYSQIFILYDSTEKLSSKLKEQQPACIGINTT